VELKRKMNPFLGTSVEAWFIWDAYLGGNAVGGFRIPLFLFSRRTSQREHALHTLPPFSHFSFDNDEEGNTSGTNNAN